MGTLLRRKGFAAAQAANGEETIALLRNRADEGFDLVILDLMMPKVSGWQVLDFIRESVPELLSHVLIVSAAGERELEQLRGACTVLAKPFDTIEFYERVRHCMRGGASGGGSTGTAAGSAALSIALLLPYLTR
jgi:DNA-binding response OmpR family regulator